MAQVTAATKKQEVPSARRTTSRTPDIATGFTSTDRSVGCRCVVGSKLPAARAPPHEVMRRHVAAVLAVCCVSSAALLSQSCRLRAVACVAFVRIVRLLQPLPRTIAAAPRYALCSGTARNAPHSHTHARVLRALPRCLPVLRRTRRRRRRSPSFCAAHRLACMAPPAAARASAGRAAWGCSHLGPFPLKPFPLSQLPLASAGRAARGCRSACRRVSRRRAAAVMAVSVPVCSIEPSAAPRPPHARMPSAARCRASKRAMRRAWAQRTKAAVHLYRANALASWRRRRRRRRRG
jgi:hypothetical protein